MNQHLQKNVFFNINKLSERVNELQKQINELNEKLKTQTAVDRSHMMRIKNGDHLADDYILNGRMYNDMSPDKAYSYYEKDNINFILLDVSKKSYAPIEELPEAIKIPFNELNIRYKEIINKATPILVISEDGTTSILACELLNNMGYYNVNNISGGYKFWPGYKVESKPAQRSA